MTKNSHRQFLIKSPAMSWVAVMVICLGTLARQFPEAYAKGLSSDEAARFVAQFLLIFTFGLGDYFILSSASKLRKSAPPSGSNGLVADFLLLPVHAVILFALSNLAVAEPVHFSTLLLLLASTNELWLAFKIWQFRVLTEGSETNASDRALARSCELSLIKWLGINGAFGGLTACFVQTPPLGMSFVQFVTFSCILRSAVDVCLNLKFYGSAIARLLQDSTD